jgi:anti-sigma factor RsiW
MHRRRTGSMTCREIVERLSDHVDGEVGAELRRAIEAHGGDCPPCRAFLRTLRATVRMVRRLPREPLAPSFQKALVRALRRSSL